MTATAAQQRPIFGLFRRALIRVRQLHPPVVLFVRAAPDETLHTLMAASKPSQHRLHLRELFTEGRRYYIEPTKQGFRMTSSSRLLWSQRRDRTAQAATLYGTLTTIGGDITVVRLHANARPFHALRAFFLPVWMSLIALSMPWQLPVRVGASLLLLLLAWAGHRLTAALQTVEMVFFVQKVLGDLPAVELPELNAARPEVVQHGANADFRAQWQRFYEEHQSD
jgi:hypothetical protein